MKRFVILLVAAVVVGGAVGGAFIGGIAIGKNQGRETALQGLQNRTSQFTSRFGQGGIQGGTGNQTITVGPGEFGGLFGMGGITGTVAKVEGGVITLNTPQGAVRVVVSDNTAIQKMSEGSLDDISLSENITVSGERNQDGSIAAWNIFITPSFGTR